MYFAGCISLWTTGVAFSACVLCRVSSPLGQASGISAVTTGLPLAVDNSGAVVFTAGVSDALLPSQLPIILAVSSIRRRFPPDRMLACRCARSATCLHAA